MAAGRHIIHELELDLEIRNRKKVHALQQTLSSLTREKILPAIEEYFDETSPGTEHLRIDTLEIDLGQLTEREIRQEFAYKAVREIQAAIDLEKARIRIASPSEQKETGQLSQENDSSEVLQHAETEAIEPKSGNKIQSEKQAKTEIILQFLQTGRMPWWHDETDKRTINQLIEENLEETPAFVRQIIKWIQKETILRRYIRQISKRIQLRILETISPGIEEKIPLIHFLIRHQNQELRKIVEEIWRQLANLAELTIERIAELETQLEISQPEQKAIKKLIASKAEPVLKKSLKKKIEEKEEAQAKTSKLKEEATSTRHKKKAVKEIQKEKEPYQPPKWSTEEIEEEVCPNAGLVLIWPFLTRLFETTGYTENQQFVDKPAQEKAIHLLHYIATGDQKPEEHQLLLPKVMCAWEWEEPLEMEMKISVKERKEVESLLRSAIEHWTAVGETSVQGMQQAFLSRSGFIGKSNDQWLVRIERTGYDILLDRLPWSISMIKLPWQQTPISVEW